MGAVHGVLVDLNAAMLEQPKEAGICCASPHLAPDLELAGKEVEQLHEAAIHSNDKYVADRAMSAEEDLQLPSTFPWLAWLLHSLPMRSCGFFLLDLPVHRARMQMEV